MSFSLSLSLFLRAFLFTKQLLRRATGTRTFLRGNLKSEQNTPGYFCCKDSFPSDILRRRISAYLSRDSQFLHLRLIAIRLSLAVFKCTANVPFPHPFPSCPWFLMHLNCFIALDITPFLSSHALTTKNENQCLRFIKSEREMEANKTTRKSTNELEIKEPHLHFLSNNGRLLAGTTLIPQGVQVPA